MSPSCLLFTSLLLFIQGVQCESVCAVRTVSKMTPVCCGPRKDDLEPLLYLSNDDTKSVAPPTTSCTTLSGLTLQPPLGAICCPSARGRICCYLQINASQRSESHWLFQSEAAKDIWFYVALTAFLLLLFSTMVLLIYCCQAAMARKYDKLGLTRPVYGSLAFQTLKPVPTIINREAILFSENEMNQYKYGTFR